MALPLPPNVIDLRGREFGRLVVKEFAYVRDRKAFWYCDCDCGVRNKPIAAKLLRSGGAKSCGCYRADPNVRRTARLQLTEEERKLAAAGEHVRPEKPAPVPRPPRSKEKILPVRAGYQPPPLPLRAWSDNIDPATIPDEVLKRERARRNAALRTAEQLGGRPASQERCPCGQNALTRAQARNFDCCRKAGVSTG